MSIKSVTRKYAATMVTLTILTAGISGCAFSKPSLDTGLVSCELGNRTGFSPPCVAPAEEIIPAEVSLEDGLTEDEAVYIALTNNSQFQAAVAQLGMAAGDAKQASLITNPQLLVYFPTAAKDGQYTLYQSIESYLLRPARVKIANREYQRIGSQLVQNGLDVARDTRLAYIDLAVASEQARLARHALEIRKSIESITSKRLSEGDISELETVSARVDQLNAKAAAGVQEQSVLIAEAKLWSIMGVPFSMSPNQAVSLEIPAVPSLIEEDLIAQALACRPDYQSANWAIASATQKSELSRWAFLRLDGILDVRSDPGRTGGGVRVDLPIFNRNQGGIMRADWELNAAQHSRDAIRDQIVADVRTSLLQLRQALSNLQILQTEVVPALSEAMEISHKGFIDGGTDYLLVLQTSTQYLDARSQLLLQKAAVLKALAQLDRAVGANIESGPMEFARLEEAAGIGPDQLEESSPATTENAEKAGYLGSVSKFLKKPIF